VGLEHEVELPGLGEGAPLAAARAQVGVLELVEAEALLAALAVDEGVVKFARCPEASHTAGGERMAASRPDDVVAQLHHRAPPGRLDVAEQEHADGPVVVGGAEAPVDVGEGNTNPRRLQRLTTWSKRSVMDTG
jgi:hypothetical protein